jgi:hypothetical protein
MSRKKLNNIEQRRKISLMHCYFIEFATDRNGFRVDGLGDEMAHSKKNDIHKTYILQNRNL